MTDKICRFCGEPIADGLQEHDFATCAHNLKDKVAQLLAELGEIQQIASSRGLDSQNAYDSVLEDIEDRCLKALGGES